MTKDKEETDLKTNVERRQRYFAKIQYTYHMIKPLPAKEEIFIARAAAAATEYEIFNDIQDKITRLNAVLDEDTSVVAVSESYEELYYPVIAKYTELTDRKRDMHDAERAAIDASIVHNDVRPLRPKLPPIDIPKFKGDFEKFPAFRSLYDTLIHNSNLATIQKFSFLKSYLDYPASSIVANFELVEENYQTAYDKLVERYTDRRLVGTHYLNKLFQFKPLPNGSAHNLRQFLDTFCVNYEALLALKVTDLADFIVFTMAMKVLDSDTCRAFEQRYAKEDFPTVKNIMSFVEDQFKVATIVQTPGISKQNSQAGISKSKAYGTGNPSVNTKSFFASSHPDGASDSRTPRLRELGCPLCKTDHRLPSCDKFKAMTPLQRLEVAKSFKLCYSCLGPHARSQCQSKYSCRVCNLKTHHTLLHRDNPMSNPTDSSDNIVPSFKEGHQVESRTKGVFSSSGKGPDSHKKLNPLGESSGTNHSVQDSINSLSCQVKSSSSSSKHTTGLLGTVICRVRSRTGDWFKCRMVIDTASESSFITEELAQILHLPRRKCLVNVIGVGSSSFSNNKGIVSCDLAPRDDDSHILSLDAIVLQSISSLLPKVQIDARVCERFQHLKLADPDFGRPGPVDILLGVQHFPEILSNNTIRIQGEPSAISTIFGFLILGRIPSIDQTTSAITMFTHTPPLEDMLLRFWESEEPIVSKPSSLEDEECESIFRDTTVRDDNGRYHVSLPFKNNKIPDELGSTRMIARKRLINLEKRLLRNPTLLDQYTANLQDYVVQDHMRVTQIPSEYILTHHAVVKESTTTKVRVVFNGSEKSDTCTSLNQFLHVGPKLQTDIGHILLNFRMNPIALTGDIQQMFRQIRLNPPDTKYTHILWRSNTTDPIEEWELTTLPFGLTCSPYLAQRVIKQLVSDEGALYPLASQALTSSIYVDDVVCSIASVEEATMLHQQLVALLKRGGFVLRKFASNHSAVLDHIPKEDQELSINFEPSDCVKLLGFIWDPSTDKFRYQVSCEPPVVTKRGILSQVARIFDINGYLTPVTFWMKYFIQRLWLAGIDWDSDLPIELKTSWLEFYGQISRLSKIRIPRYISMTIPSKLTLIGFSDASKKGFAACVYLRVEAAIGTVQVNLLKAKSRVAPVKPITISRMELNGALLLSKLLNSLTEFCSKNVIDAIFCYCDSTTVLSWLHTPPHLLKTYVSNRVVQILESFPSNQWRHVPGILNPADIGSRGLYPNQIQDNKVWWQGPSYLQRPISEWPNQEVDIIEPIPEGKPDTVSLMSTENTDPHESSVENLIAKYTVTKAQRILGYVLRFIHNIRVSAENRISGPFTHVEMTRSLNKMIHSTQGIYFGNVIRRVKDHLPIKGSIKCLTPFLDGDGLLRVGGRLKHAPIPESQKHPCLIPRQSKLAERLCEYYHKITLHGGPQLVQSLLQRQYWIPGVRYLLRSISFKCIKCYRFKAKPLEPFMSDVPSHRFQMGRAFVNIGVDLAGPYVLKESNRRNARRYKGWVVLFICLSTRAVHIDIVVDLSTAAFLSSLDRFIARRGIPAKIFSDQGTNFVGAAREIREAYEALMQDKEEIQMFFLDKQIEWQFNPPASPNFGGSWEAAVKSMKHHLKRVIADHPCTYDEFITVLAKVEAILNSRPLSSLSSNPSDGFDYLTTGHFLVGAPLVLSRPEPNLLDGPCNLTHRWRMITRAMQDLWKRWSHEYLHTLIQRSKWTHMTPNLAVGNLVLISEKNLPPNSWLLGRVIECMPGMDGVVRTVKLRTPVGERIRPVNKLCLLPCQE